ncbi:MAG: hypothetical protein N2317_04035 [Syntrophales bacterium]|nr:hypothetical protein [Syntrophales bacterium]
MNVLHILTLTCISSITIAYQIVLMQFLSTTQWYHFAYMVISIALLGFGASGTVLCFTGERWCKRFEWFFPSLTITMGATIAGCSTIVQHPLLRFDSYMIFLGAIPFFKLLLTYVTFTVPFLLAGTAIGLTFIKYRNHIGLVYFWNLIGAATGGVISLLLLNSLHLSYITGVLGLFTIVCGSISLPHKRNAFTILLIFLTTIYIVYEIKNPKKLIPSEYKDISRVLLYPSAKIEKEVFSSYGLLQIVSSPIVRFAPGLSLVYTGNVPNVRSVFINGDYVGPIPSGTASEIINILDHTTQCLPYHIGPRKKILILGASTGVHAFHAIAKNPHKVTIVEMNPILVNLIREELSHHELPKNDWSKIDLINDDPRGWLQKTKEKFDTVILPVLYASFGGTGMNALSEHYLFTIDALEDMWQILTPDGIIIITCFVDNPPRYSLRLLASLLQLLENRGIKDTKNHIAAVQSWNTITFVVKKSVLTPKEVVNIKRFCNIMKFTPLIIPNERPQQSLIHHGSSEELLPSAIDQLLSPGRETFIKEYEFHISPVTDMKPFFAQFLKLEKVPYLARIIGRTNLPFLEVGYIVVFLTLLQILPLAFTLIVPALLQKNKDPKIGKKRVFFYFGGIGMGFMCAEIALINLYNLYFGFPIKTAAYVIAFVLLASGLGSYFTTKINSFKEKIEEIHLVLIPPLMILYAILLYPAIKHTMGYPFIVKKILFIIFTFPPAFLMGMPFPLGVRSITHKNSHLFAWAWGVNGCFSVLGSVVSMIISVEWGFSSLLFFASFAYTISFLTFPGRSSP